MLRGLLVTTVLVTLYYLLPLDQPWDAATAVRLLIGLLVFAGVTAWQIRAITGSRYPAMRAFEALGLIVPFYLLLFASTYFVMERASAAWQAVNRNPAYCGADFSDRSGSSSSAPARKHSAPMKVPRFDRSALCTWPVAGLM